MQTDIDFSAVC